MPYSKIDDLPPQVKDHLPRHGQVIFKEAFNSAYDEYQDPDKRRNPEDDAEEIAFKVAWSAVKEKYHKEGERWVANTE